MTHLTYQAPCPICARSIRARSVIGLDEAMENHIDRCAKRHRKNATKALIKARQTTLFGGAS